MLKHFIENNQGMFALYTAIFFMSLAGLFSKTIPLDAVTITQHRTAIGVMIFLVFFLSRGNKIGLPNVKTYLGVYGLGVLIGMHWITFFHAMQVSTIAIGVISLFTYPVITVLIEPLFSRERLQPKDLIMAVIVFSGILVMVGNELISGQNLFLSGTLQGAFWGVVSAVFMSLRHTIQKYHFPTVPSSGLMFHQVLIVALMLVPFADFSSTISETPKTWLLLGLLGLLPTVIGHTMLVVSLKRLPAKTVAIIGCMQPVIASFMAWLVLGEVPTLFVVAGGLIILFAAAYESLTQSKSKK